MKRLGGTDALFLSLETPAWHQHVGGLTILDTEGSDITFERVVAQIEQRLPLAPKFRWKLKSVPLHLDRPVWVDDPDFDVRNHTRSVRVAAPGGPREVAEVANELFSTQLDRSKPLWELWYLEGLANGRAGMAMKYHHCLLDGMAGASLATVLADLEPNPDPSTLPPPPPEEQSSAGAPPNDFALLARSVPSLAARPFHAVRYVGAGAARLAAMANVFRRDEGARAMMRSPKTPFNARIGPKRALAFASVSLDDVRQLKQKHGVKVNDVVLALCAGALRSYLDRAGELPDDPLVSGVPVSTRADGDTAMDNQVASMFVSLATNEADPIERLHAIYQSSHSAKEMMKAVRARQIQSIGEVASPLILATAIRAVYETQLIARSPARVNTLVSNIPGPPIPIYMCGARVAGIYASSVILEGMGVNVTLLSYVDRIDFGVHVDPELVPDPWEIAEGIPAALAELMEASSLGPPTPVEDPFGEGVTPEAAPAS
jgi:diacylglycerol O-acyltransferase / wax synthase